MTFWDSSALAPLLLDEPSSQWRENQLLGNPQIVVWHGTPVELESAIARRLREGHLSDSQALEAREKLALLSAAWIEVEPTDTVRTRAIRVVRTHPLRTGDAFQLAAALVVTGENPVGHQFLTGDTRLALAAQTEGFHVG